MSPNRIRKACKYPGCSELVSGVYCEKHQQERQEQLKQNTKPKRTDEDRARHRLYDRRWKSRRAAQLAREPWCADCLRVGIYTGATDVHHLVRHEGDTLLFISSPLLSLCHECHSRRTLGEIRGEREDYYPQLLTPITLPVYLVCGAPASGKTTFVSGQRRPGDIVIDLDVIIAELSGHDIYHPEHQETVREGFRIRNRMLEGLYQRADRGQSVWMVVSAADPRDRMIWRDLLKPRAVYILICPQEECFNRIDKDNRRLLVADDQKRAIVRWLEKYQPLPGEEIVSYETN